MVLPFTTTGANGLPLAKIESCYTSLTQSLLEFTRMVRAKRLLVVEVLDFELAHVFRDLQLFYEESDAALVRTTETAKMELRRTEADEARARETQWRLTNIILRGALGARRGQSGRIKDLEEREKELQDQLEKAKASGGCCSVQ